MLGQYVLLEDSAGSVIEAEHGDVQRQDVLGRRLGWT